MTLPSPDEGADALQRDLSEIKSLLLDPDTLVRAVVSGRRRNHVVRFRRVEVRYVDLKAGRALQLTSYDDQQSYTRNVAAGAVAERAVDDLVAQPYASWHVETATETVQLRVTKKDRPMLHRKVKATPDVPVRSHDREKPRRLEASDPLFARLGISTADGQVKPRRIAKFRQVQDLLAALEPLVADAVRLGPADAMSADRPLRMVDLGCGNAYLTFAAFRYLTAAKGLPVDAVGIDVKAQARAHNADIAAELGFADRLRFVQSTIGAAKLPHEPDLVLALHACDTATDEALARAVTWQAPVIVAAPCCHHDIQRQLSSGTTPAPYRLVTRHGILRERFADVLTDALRAAILRIVGYRVEVIEFVDSQHTPRNALIRAVRTSAPPDDATLESYRSLVTGWGVTPALATMLSQDFPVLRARG